MGTLTETQTNLLACIQAGAKLSWIGAAVGRFHLVDGGITRTIDPRTVEALLKHGALERNLVGVCRLADGYEQGPSNNTSATNP